MLNWCIISICFSWKPEEHRFSFMHTRKQPAQVVRVSFIFYTCKSQAIIYIDYIMRQSVSFQNSPSAEAGHTCRTTESHLAHKSHAQERYPLCLTGNPPFYSPYCTTELDCSHLLLARPKYYTKYGTFSPQTSKEASWGGTTISLVATYYASELLLLLGSTSKRLG